MISEQKITKLQSILSLPRINILTHLLNGEACVCEMVSDLAIKHNALSYHLNILTQEGFLNSNRHGRHIRYSIKTGKRDCVKKIFSLLDNEKCK
jgi:ArsR family transcriptional regulator